MVEHLRAMREELKDFNIAALLLGGSPASCDTLVIELDVHPNDKPTM